MEQENNKQGNITGPLETTIELGDNDNFIKELHRKNATGVAEPFNEDSSHQTLTTSTSSTSDANFHTIENLTKIETMQEDKNLTGSKDLPASESNKLLTSQDSESCKKDPSNSSPASPPSSMFRTHIYNIEELLKMRVTGEEYLSSELTKTLENLVCRGPADQSIDAPEQDPSFSLCTTPSISTHELVMYPISDLSPNVYNWKIKARVTKKTESQNWNTSKSRGKCFSVYLLDESGEIKATGYNDQCDQFYDSFQEGAVYYISSPCKIQNAKKQYSTLSNDYELFFDRDTIVETAEDQEAIPQIRYEFTTISDLQYVEIDSLVDVIGILKDVPECTQTTVRKTGRPCDKRELSIYDESNETIRLTIWGSTALSFSAKPDTIVAFKRCKVGEYGGRSLSLLSSGSLNVDPDIPEAHKLKNWHTPKPRWDKPVLNTPILSAGLESSRWNQARETPQVREREPDFGGWNDVKETSQFHERKSDFGGWNDVKETPQNREREPDFGGWNDVKETSQFHERKSDFGGWNDVKETPQHRERKSDFSGWNDVKETSHPRERKSDFGGWNDVKETSHPRERKSDFGGWNDVKETSHPHEREPEFGGWNNVKETPQARERDFSMPDSSDHSPIKATIVHINQENCAYPACRTDGCYKKLSDMGDGSWYCEKCDFSHSRPEYRFCLSLKVHNSTMGFFWLSCSDDVGRFILGIDANKIIRLREYNISGMLKYFANADGKTFSFKVRPKKKNNPNQQGIYYEVINATPIDCVEEADKLTGIIKSFQDNLYEQFPSFPYHAF